MPTVSAPEKRMLAAIATLKVLRRKVLLTRLSL
jgi:hypothetical protein